MAQSVMLKAKGLYTFPNILSAIPEGALLESLNCVIDRNEVIEPRRGMFQYGTVLPNAEDRTKQLINYKNRILRHYYDNTNTEHRIQYDDGNGTFSTFNGAYEPITNSNLRIKSIEANGNLYFTSNEGIKKISALSASDFTTASGFITNAGGVKAIDIQAEINYNEGNFLSTQSQVAYRIVWGITDQNDNLILGAPSASFTIQNLGTTDSAGVDLTIPIPDEIGTNVNYFYQIYRTGVFPNTSSVGDEMYLVIEDFPTSAELTAQSVSVTDITSEDFRRGGTLLYTNPISGEGISQANEKPPFSRDITSYKGYTFYANTTSPQRLNLNVLSADSFEAFTITSITNVGGPPSTTVEITTSSTHGLNNGDDILLAGIGDAALDDTIFTVSNVAATTFEITVPSGTYSYSFGRAYKSYIIISDGTTSNRYFFVGMYETYTLDLSAFGGTIPGDLDDGGSPNTGLYFTLVSAKDERKYIVSYDPTGSAEAPSIPGYINIHIDISSGITTSAQLASATKDAIDIATGDFNISIGGAGSDVLTIECANHGNVNTRTSYNVDTTTSLVDEGADTILLPNHGFNNNDLITYSSTTTDIGGLTSNNQYYIIVVDDDTIQLESTIGGGAIDLTSDGAGTHYFMMQNIGNDILLTQDNHGDGEDTDLQHVFLPKIPGINEEGPGISQQIDEFSRSLLKNINLNGTELIYGYYLSGFNDVPGQLTLESRERNADEFYIYANNETTAREFNEELGVISVNETEVISSSEVNPNRIYYSKFQQPEAVPLLNFIDVGPKDKKILRIIGLRDSLFIMKEDGVYRLTGSIGPFGVSAFDSSIVLKAPDTAVVLNNQIYALTSQGVSRISDTSSLVISRPIENQLLKIIKASFTNMPSASFAVSYETDRAYLLWTLTDEDDSNATQCFRFNSFTQSWTRWDVNATCGLVNDADDKLYIGATDIPNIEKERKDLNRRDHADRQYDFAISSVVGTEININSTTNVEINDVFTQTQYLTISQFNRLLSQLDLDPSIGDTDYVSTLQMEAGSNLRNSVTSLANKLDSDSGTVSAYSGLVTGSTDFATIQSEFNAIVTTLNADSGVFFSSYDQSSGTVEYEGIVDEIDTNNNIILTIKNIPLIPGPIVLYKYINVDIKWAPQIFGDPSTQKQVREGTFIFEDNNYTKATASYSTDLSPSFESIEYNRFGKGEWNQFSWGEHYWGGVSAAVPFRTYIPRQKQRCRYMNIRFQHGVAREKFSLFGVSLTFRPYSTRAYR